MATHFSILAWKISWTEEYQTPLLKLEQEITGRAMMQQKLKDKRESLTYLPGYKFWVKILEKKAFEKH